MLTGTWYFTVYSIQGTAYRVKYRGYSIQGTIYWVTVLQYTGYSIQ